jgi:hypothetical protein
MTNPIRPPSSVTCRAAKLVLLFTESKRLEAAPGRSCGLIGNVESEPPNAATGKIVAANTKKIFSAQGLDIKFLEPIGVMDPSGVHLTKLSLEK